MKKWIKKKNLNIPKDCRGCYTVENCPFSNYYLASLFDSDVASRKNPSEEYAKLAARCPCRLCLIKGICMEGCEEFQDAEFDHTSPESDKQWPDQKNVKDV